MVSSVDPSALLFPESLFEQDYLVFLSFFGWMLVGLLAWTKPLCDRQNDERYWVWFGYFAFAEAMADFIRALSFSDPFFRTFSIETPLEMLGLGCLIELSLRRLNRYKGKRFPPMAAIACALLGFAIEVSSMLYSLIVAFMVSTVACLWFVSTLGSIAREQGCKELYVILAGVLTLIPAWVLHPDHLAFVRNETLVSFDEFPFYGFLLLFLRIVSAWLILGGFWYYRLQARVEDVGPGAQERLKFLGFRVLPGSMVAVILASYLVTIWNGRSEREEMESGFLSRSETAALSIDRALVEGEHSAGRDSLESSLRSIRGIGESVSRVYLWRDTDAGLEVLFDGANDNEGTVIVGNDHFVKEAQNFKKRQPFVVGPARIGSNLVLNVSSPIRGLDEESVLVWLGIDVGAKSWMKDISLARLQTIVIAGLVLALLIFFLYYQIENESEADLALAKERAEAVDRAKSEFLAVISHEIRTPLQSVLGYSNLLRGTRLDEKQMSCLDTIQSEGKILLRIVQDILDFSNLRKASSELKEEAVPLRRLIDETFRTIRPMAERKGLVAKLDVADAIPAVVQTDGVRLRQVLLNLVGNSVKYTDTGNIRFAIRRSSASRDSGKLDFVISDSGVGIKDVDLERLFEPFIQLEHVGTSPREGAGLGLAIVKRIVELMGGSISVKSVYGEGSEFTVSFDFTVLEQEELVELEANRGDAELEESLSLGEKYPLEVLVVDDNPMVRGLIAQYFESLGYSPDQFEDGKPASEKGAAYDLIVTDLRMPGMTGPEAATIIRRNSGLADQPWIIGVSATLAEDEIARAMRSGINDFIGKPFFAGDLEERIRRIPWLEQLAKSGNNVAEEEASAEEAFEETGPDPESSTAFAGHGMGVFSDEMIATALAEVHELCDKMESAEGRGDFDFVKETAHYLSNTAMAIGIESLYIDSKALQKAAEDRRDDCFALVESLKANFAAWETAR
ncbi:MAG: ATP-binding protein [Opitutales bacterium]